MEHSPHGFPAVVKARREELGLTQQQVAERAAAAGFPFSGNTYRNVETGRTKVPRPAALRSLDAGLDWPEGTAAGHVHGELSGASHDVLPPVTGDHQAVMVLLDCLTANQRAVVFKAVREWVDDHPEYAEHLGVQVSLGDLDITPDELASLGEFLSGLARRREAG